MFKKAHPEVVIGFTKFTTLRPVNVLILKDQPADQCKCKLHENFRLMLLAVKINYENSFWSEVLCDDQDLTSESWRGVCNECKEGKKFKIERHDDESVNLKQWSKGDTGRIKIHFHQSTVADVREKVLSEIGQLQEHVRVKRIQADAFESEKANEHSHVQQCDFAMAYRDFANINRSNLHCSHVIVSICSLLHCTAETPLANHILLSPTARIRAKIPSLHSLTGSLTFLLVQFLKVIPWSFCPFCPRNLSAQ